VPCLNLCCLHSPGPSYFNALQDVEPGRSYFKEEASRERHHRVFNLNMPFTVAPTSLGMVFESPEEVELDVEERMGKSIESVKNNLVTIRKRCHP